MHELRFAIRDRLASLPERVVFVTAAANGADHTSIGEHEHLRADALRGRAGGRHDRDQRSGFAALERVADGGKDLSIHSGDYKGPTDGRPTPADGEPKATDGEPKATDGASKATDGASKATDGASKATDGTSKATDGASKATDGAPKATDGAPKPTDGESKPTDGESQRGDYENEWLDEEF